VDYVKKKKYHRMCVTILTTYSSDGNVTKLASNHMHIYISIESGLNV
jgi:hypothetical protein